MKIKRHVFIKLLRLNRLLRGGHTAPPNSGRTAGAKPDLAAVFGGNTDKPTYEQPAAPRPTPHARPPLQTCRTVAGHQDLGIKLLPVGPTSGFFKSAHTAYPTHYLGPKSGFFLWPCRCAAAAAAVCHFFL
jgi:hypothetical protein